MKEEAVASSTRSRVPQLMLLLILCLSAFIQLSVVSRSVVDQPLRADARDYFSYAYNLRNFGVYSSEVTWTGAHQAPTPSPDKNRSPGYPLFLLMVGNPEPTDAYLRKVSFLQAGLGVASVLLVYLIGASFLGRGFALAGALVAAINPFLATISTYLLTESLFTFLLMAGAYALIKAVKSGSYRTCALAGVLWGLCSLVRPTAELFPPLILAAVVVLPRLRPLRMPATLAFACFLAVLSPWIARNQSAALERTGSDLMVNSLAHGSYPGFMYENRPETFGFPYRFDPEIKEITRDLPSILKHISRQFREQPVHYARWYLIGKPYFFLSLEDVQSFDVLIYPVSHTPYYEDVRFAFFRVLAALLHWPLVILGLMGAIIVALRPAWLRLDPPARGGALLMAWVIGYAIAFHMIVAPFPRYGIPFRPLLYLLALLPIRAAIAKIRRSSEV